MSRDVESTVSGLSALAQETRLRVFRTLLQTGEAGMAAGKLAEQLNISPSNMSGHLNILANAEIVTFERDGRNIIYRARVETVQDLLNSVLESV